MSEKDPVWDECDDHCKDINLQPGMTFETSLLGRVPFHMKDGEYVSFIPSDLQYRAKLHGYLIVGADYKSGFYAVQLGKVVEPPQASVTRSKEEAL